MNSVYIRMVLYFLAPLAALIPGVAYDSIAQTVLIDLDTAAMGLAGSAAFSAVVFKVWGKK